VSDESDDDESDDDEPDDDEPDDESDDESVTKGSREGMSVSSAAASASEIGS
jgi:hypothetical protein